MYRASILPPVVASFSEVKAKEKEQCCVALRADGVLRGMCVWLVLWFVRSKSTVSERFIQRTPHTLMWRYLHRLRFHESASFLHSASMQTVARRCNLHQESQESMPVLNNLASFLLFMELQTWHRVTAESDSKSDFERTLLECTVLGSRVS